MTVGFFLAVAEVAATIERPALERSVLRNVEANSLAVLRPWDFLEVRRGFGEESEQGGACFAVRCRVGVDRSC